MVNTCYVVGMPNKLFYSILFYIITIYHKCEDGIEKSILMITVWHPEVVGSKVVIILLFTHCLFLIPLYVRVCW